MKRAGARRALGLGELLANDASDIRERDVFASTASRREGDHDTTHLWVDLSIGITNAPARVPSRVIAVGVLVATIAAFGDALLEAPIGSVLSTERACPLGYPARRGLLVHALPDGVEDHEAVFPASGFHGHAASEEAGGMIDVRVGPPGGKVTPERVRLARQSS